VVTTESLITNPLTVRVGITHQIDDVYVDLRLERRNQLTKCQPNVSSECQLDLEKDSQTFEAKEFFQEVLKPRLNSESCRKPIVIIGESGAGKSIFLQKIGDWIFSTEESKEVAIWLSMRDVGTRNLSQYLLEDWLIDVVGELESVAPKWQSVLKKLLERGQVWLLLDGVEEIGEQSLTFLAEQLKEG
jgi:predicted NACHT family NTPase